MPLSTQMCLYSSSPYLGEDTHSFHPDALLLSCLIRRQVLSPTLSPLSLWGKSSFLSARTEYKNTLLQRLKKVKGTFIMCRQLRTGPGAKGCHGDLGFSCFFCPTILSLGIDSRVHKIAAASPSVTSTSQALAPSDREPSSFYLGREPLSRVFHLHLLGQSRVA